jgi:hypothetical protein
LLRAQERCRRLGDEACVLDSITGSGRGRWRCVRALTMVGNDGAEDSMMARAPGRSTVMQAPGKFSAGNFGSLTV